MLVFGIGVDLKDKICVLGLEGGVLDLGLGGCPWPWRSLAWPWPWRWCPLPWLSSFPIMISFSIFNIYCTLCKFEFDNGHIQPPVLALFAWRCRWLWCEIWTWTRDESELGQIWIPVWYFCHYLVTLHHQSGYWIQINFSILNFIFFSLWQRYVL